MQSVLICRTRCQNKFNYPNVGLSRRSDGGVFNLEQFTSDQRVEYCLTNENTRGICIRVSQCSSAKRDFRKKPSICYWDNLEPIVCCNQNEELTGVGRPSSYSQNQYTQNQNYNLPNSYPQSFYPQQNSYATQPYVYQQQQQQQQFVVTQIPIRDSNKPISVRPSMNVISQNKNYHLLSTTSSPSLMFKRTDLPPDLTTTRSPFKRNNEPHTETNLKDPRNPSDQLSNVNSSRRNSNKKQPPGCGRRLNINNLPANRIVKGDCFRTFII